MEDPRQTTVLLVDADEAHAALIRNGLLMGGFATECVHDLHSALAHLDKRAADAVVLDPELSDSEPLEAVSAVRGKVPNTPIVVVTALADEKIATQAMRRGAQDVLAKQQTDHHAIARAVRYALERKFAGEALRESEERFRRVFEEGPVGMALVGRDSKMVRANAALGQMLGYAETELRGMGITQLMSEVETAELDQVDRVYRGEIPYYQLEAQFQKKSGSVVWGLLTASSVRGEKDRPLYGIAIVEDFTERKRAEDAVRESHSLLHAVIGGTPDAVYVKDLKGRYLLLNSAASRLLGKPASDVVGRTDEEILAPDVAKRIRASDRMVIDVDEPRTFEESFESGDRVRTYLSTKGVYRDESEVAVGLFGIARDITERKEAENELRRSEEKYRALIDNAVYGIYRSTLDGRFLSVNPALVRMLGYDTEDDLLDISMERDLYADPTERERLIGQYSLSDRVEGLEVDWIRGDRKRIRVRLSGRTVHDDAGRLQGFEMIVEDVTERRTLETQLRQAQKMEAVGELTGGIAHDLNNVLTIISANLDVLVESGPSDSGDMRADLQQIQEAARRGRTLIKKLLGFSRRSTLEIKPVDVGRLVAELLDMLRRVVPVSIDVRLTVTDDVVIEADAGAIEQILVNLVTNARDAMPDGGCIDMTLGRCRLTDEYRATRPWAKLDECVRIRVADTGAGMDSQTVERIFEPFFTTKPHGLGTGLGMAMVYGLVKQHGGFVDVESEVGRGTTIDLFFPLSKQQALIPAGDDVQHDVRGGSETILVVEDEEPIRRIARRVLEKHGYRVLTAVDGQDALEQYRVQDRQIDLVISDVVMPKMGGARLYEELSADGSPPKVLFTSGYTAGDFRTSGALDPSLPFLHKPWSVSEMLQKVREVLDS